MKPIKSLYTNCALTSNTVERAVYCVAWSPKDDSWILAGYGNGDVLIWDYIKGKCLMKLNLGNMPIRWVDWNRLRPLYVACSSQDGNW